MLIDLNHRDKLLSHGIEQLDERRIGGWRQSKAWANNQWVYFTMEFDHEIARVITSQDGKQAIVEFDYQRSNGEKSNPRAAANIGGDFIYRCQRGSWEPHL